MIAPAIRAVQLVEDGGSSLADVASDLESPTVRIRPHAWEDWATSARWFRLTAPDGRSCRLLVAPPLCVLERTMASALTRVCGPQTSGPSLFFAAVRTTTFAPAKFDTTTLLEVGPRAVAWLRSQTADSPTGGGITDALRFDHGWGHEVTEEAAWLRLGRDWIAVSDLPEPELSSPGDPSGPSRPGTRCDVLSMWSLAVSMSLAMATDLVAAYTDEELPVA